MAARHSRFVPTVDEFWLVANADDNGSSNSLSYNFDVRDYEGFNDNVSFQFEGSSTGYATVTPGYSGKSMSELVRYTGV